jgi:hypothetical protein
MVKNLGAFDRGARLAAAALLAFSASTTSVDGWMAILFYAIAAYLAITALVGQCLLYRALDINSRAHAGEYHSGPVE